MATIIHKFDWAQKGEWSVSVTPEEAAIMSRLVDDYFYRLNYQPADPPPPPADPYFGCPHPDRCGQEGCHGCDEPVTSRMKR